MITNLVAAVSIFMVTNTTETLPKNVIVGGGTPDCPTCAVVNYTFVDQKDPKEKWVTTSIVERHELAFMWKDQYWAVTNDVPLTNLTVHFEKSDKWIESAKNTPIPGSWSPLNIQNVFR